MQASIKLVSIPLLLVMACAAGSPDVTNSNAGLSTDDRLFIVNAAIEGMTEVKAGQLAEKKGTTDAIRAFGKRLQDDHAQVGDPLKVLAASKSVSLPSGLDAKHQATINTLNIANGKDFDMAFIMEMKQNHAETIARFDRASASKDEDVSTFARTNLSILKDHAENIPSTAR